MEKKNYFAGVYILNLTYDADKIYDYYLNEDLRNKISKGDFVTVPFGGGNKKRIAVVFELKNESKIENTKPVEKILAAEKLNDEQLELALFLKDTTFCTIGEAIRSVSIGGNKLSLSYIYSINKENYDPAYLYNNLSKKALLVLSYILGKKTVPIDELRDEFGENISQTLKVLCDNKMILEEEETEGEKKEKTERAVRLNIDEYHNNINRQKKAFTPKQEAVIDYLMSNNDVSVAEICEYLDIGAGVIKTLEKYKYVNIYERKNEKALDSYQNINEPEKNVLSAAQEEALENLNDLYKNSKPCAALLHGITGSGKTHILKELIDRVIADGKQVIMLVPEIGLTPQMIVFFKYFYGDRAAILHSSVTQQKKLETIRRIKNNEIDLVIGTRLAIFSPFDNLGLIIIDEEQEHTYKSEQKPYYHAREVARFRCGRHNAMLVLSSATPSVESYYKAKTNNYHLISLTERYGNAMLPEIITVDMRSCAPDEKMFFISDTLKNELAKNLQNMEQSIIYQNRRGYYNFLSCRSCGNVIICPNCSISLKIHTLSRYRDISSRRTPDRLVCHYCGYSSDILKICPECGSDKLTAFGTGTQKCEDDIGELFPEANILRMDADTTNKKDSYERIYEQITNNDIDILVGTQMVTKGHNFKNVTLVGILFADDGLFLDDYRANERTFKMIVQVAGRAGRADKTGRAVIQTYNPDNEIIKAAIKQNYQDFFEREIKLRKSSVFPPFCDICAVNIISEFENEAETTARKIGEIIKEKKTNQYSDIYTIIYGPFPANVYRVNKQYRLKYIIKCKSNKRFRAMMSEILIEINKNTSNKVNVFIDINPISGL